MSSIEVNGQIYEVIEEKEVASGIRYRKETLCEDLAGNNFLLWTFRQNVSSPVKGSMRLIAKHYIAKLNRDQVELWKANNFDVERQNLNGIELNKGLKI